MKKQPIDSLTEEDKYTIEKYIFLYANCRCGPLDIVLKEWNKSKRRLYHAFGDQLRMKKKIKIKKDIVYMNQMLNKIYYYYPVYSKTDMVLFENYLKNYKDDRDFFKDFCSFVLYNEKLAYEEKKYIFDMFRYRNITRGYLDFDFKFKNFSFSVRNGAKTIRTIQKCIKALKYPNVHLFNKWRNEVSNINSNNIEDVVLVLSIHPIDFMTMSDNNCNWSSCMSWTNKGCYHAGTIEMMNSNVTAVAYLETKEKFKIILDEEHTLKISNKSWRSLVYCHKDIILVGKSYPYSRDELSKEVINFMMEAVEKRFGWTYKFKNQLYRDISNFHNNDFLKFNCIPTKNQHKRIVIHTNGMYNDIIEDTGFNYWCCRNYTKGLKLSVSGKLTCMCCGKPIFDNYISSPEDVNGTKICDSCSVYKRCQICDIVDWTINDSKRVCSDECKKEAVFFKGQNSIMKRSDFLNNSRGKLFYIITKNDMIKDNIADYINSFSSTKEILKKLQDDFVEGRDYVLASMNRRFYSALLWQKNIPYISWQYSFNRDLDKFYLMSFIQRHKKFVYTPSFARYTHSINVDSIDKNIKDFFKLIQKPIEYYYYDNEGRMHEGSYSLIGKSSKSIW